MIDSDILPDDFTPYKPDIDELLAGFNIIGDRAELEAIVCKPGYINLDFNDVFNSFTKDGPNYVVTGFGEGSARIMDAINDAIAKLPAPLSAYKSILLQFYFAKNTDTPVKVSELQGLNAWFDKIYKDIRIVWGIAHDDTLASRIKVTIIAS